jgi:hypothetical protein
MNKVNYDQSLLTFCYKSEYIKFARALIYNILYLRKKFIRDKTHLIIY